MSKPLEDLPHGDESTYSNHDCRCEPCVAAHAVATRGYRARRKARLLADPTVAVHGTKSTYSNWSCRCQECTDAQTEDHRRWREARR